MNDELKDVVDVGGVTLVGSSSLMIAVSSGSMEVWCGVLFGAIEHDSRKLSWNIRSITDAELVWSNEEVDMSPVVT